MATVKYPPEDLKLHLGQSEGELSGKSPRWPCWGDHAWIQHWCCLVHKAWGSRGWHSLLWGIHWGKWICRKMVHLKNGLLRTKRIMGWWWRKDPLWKNFQGDPDLAHSGDDGGAGNGWNCFDTWSWCSLLTQESLIWFQGKSQKGSEFSQESLD